MPRGPSPRARHPVLYRKLPFFIAIALQLLSSLAVAGIMFYFIAHLTKNGYSLPWMFYFLQGSALATIISTVVLRGWSIFRSPVPKICTFVSGLLMATWAAGFGTLVQAMEDNITWPCNVAYWGNSEGIMVCSFYKTLFVGAGVGFVSTLAVLIVDILAWRKSKTMLKLRGGEGVLGNPVGTEYKPVWAESSTNHHKCAVRLEPMRDGRE